VLFFWSNEFRSRYMPVVAAVCLLGSRSRRLCLVFTLAFLFSDNWPAATSEEIQESLNLGQASARLGIPQNLASNAGPPARN
jgi:hypothetical protein